MLEDGRFLVTGGTGFLGSALIHTLVGRGVPPARIRVPVPPGTTTSALAGLPGLELRPGDLLDGRQVEQALAGVRWVFHLAGSTTFDPRGKRLQWLLNVEGTRNLLEGCLRSPTVRKIVHTSTVNVLGLPDPPGSLGTEDTDPYTARRRLHRFGCAAEALAFADAVREGRAGEGWWKGIGVGYLDSKLAGQELVDRYGREHGLPVCSVLPGTCFGPHGTADGSGLYLLAVWRNALPGYLPGGGIPCTHVYDQAEGQLLALSRGRAGRRYILTGREEDNLAFREVFRVIAGVLAEQAPRRRIRVPSLPIPVPLAALAARAGEAGAGLLRRPCRLSRDAVRLGACPSFYSHARAARELGYAPRRTFAGAVVEHFQWLRERGLPAAP